MRNLLVLVVAVPAAVLVTSCSSASTAPPLLDCPTCTFRPGQIIIAPTDGGADAAKPDSGTPADSGTDTGTPDTGTPVDSGFVLDGSDGAP